MSIFKPTLGLRFVNRPIIVENTLVYTARVLQQAWENINTGETKWEDIPLEEE